MEKSSSSVQLHQLLTLQSALKKDFIEWKRKKKGALIAGISSIAHNSQPGLSLLQLMGTSSVGQSVNSCPNEQLLWGFVSL